MTLASASDAHVPSKLLFKSQLIRTPNLLTPVFEIVARPSLLSVMSLYALTDTEL